MRHVHKPHKTIDHQTRSTSDKIDAIESELSAEFGTAQWLPSENSITGDKTLPALSQCLDEAALLFTNRQMNAARELLLRVCSHHAQDDECHHAWWMLFELALEQNQPEFFDQLALDYASLFETSPPQWRPALESPVTSGFALPTLSFRGKLTGNSQPALHQLRQAGAKHMQFCLTFGAISEIDLAGCALLLHVFAHWQRQRCTFTLVDGDLLAQALRPLVHTGRRDENDAGWRLLIELMRLMNRREEHESLCISYCLTYEVSPPTGLLAETEPIRSLAAAKNNDHFLLPACIMLPVDELLIQIQQYAQTAEVITLDGRLLTRVELSAAAPWLNGLHRATGGKPVECRNMGFLVARLLKLVGGDSSLTIIHRKP